MTTSSPPGRASRRGSSARTSSRATRRVAVGIVEEVLLGLGLRTGVAVHAPHVARLERSGPGSPGSRGPSRRGREIASSPRRRDRSRASLVVGAGRRRRASTPWSGSRRSSCAAAAPSSRPKRQPGHGSKLSVSSRRMSRRTAADSGVAASAFGSGPAPMPPPQALHELVLAERLAVEEGAASRPCVDLAVEHLLPARARRCRARR